MLLYEDFFLSDEKGEITSIPLYVADSKQTYLIEVFKQGYVRTHSEVTIKKGSHTSLSITMEPVKDEIKKTPPDRFDLLSKTITVHLGQVYQEGETITMPFLSYLKNVACSQLYPTWPYQALKAAIRDQLRMILHLMESQWYRQQGYSFDITNTAHFDPAYVKNRNIFDSISNIVDEVVQEYTQDQRCGSSTYPGHAFQEKEHSEVVLLLQKALNTIASQYPAIPVLVMDGMFETGTKHAVCTFQRVFGLPVDGITKKATWDAIFGTAAQIEQSDLPGEGRPLFPGTPLQLYSHGDDVLLMQSRLQIISLSYSSIPKPKIDGMFLETTHQSVLAFQRLLGLSIHGIIDQMTWSQINQVYEELRASS